MSKNIEHDYLRLLNDILINGTHKQTRNGETLSVFGRQIRHDMSTGFPLLTTKKMYWKGIVTELLWFLRGDTNIKYLVDNDCHIWDGDAYQFYLNNYSKDLGNGKHESLGSDIKWVSDDEWPNGKALAYTKEEFINKIKTDDEFAKKWGDLGKIYGYQWRNWGSKTMYDDGNPNPNRTPGMDQITNLINDLKTNPDSRRLLVSAWNPSDLPHQVLPPCHYGFQVYTRELSYEERCDIFKPNTKNFRTETNSYIKDLNIKIMNDCEIPTRAISLMWNQRSVDTFLGLPFNIASYALLLEIIAVSVNMVPGELIGNLGDVHLYSNHIEQAKEQLTREPYTLPKFNINTEWWPYEGGECGIGPIDAVKVFESFKDEYFCKCLLEEDLQLYDYQSHPKIKASVSN